MTKAPLPVKITGSPDGRTVSIKVDGMELAPYTSRIEIKLDIASKCLQLELDLLYLKVEVDAELMVFLKGVGFSREELKGVQQALAKEDPGRKTPDPD